MRMPFDLSLYLVLDPDLCTDFGFVETARAAAENGVTMVQLRDKDASTAQRIELGMALKSALSGTGVQLIVNDDIEAAIAIAADGLHVGQSDGNVATARRRIGPDMILGLSAETPELAGRIDPTLVDYAGIGPVFATATKPDHKQPIGLTGLATAVERCPVPAVAIGGLKANHVADVFRAGAKGLAVVSAICGRPDPGAAARELSSIVAKEKP